MKERGASTVIFLIMLLQLVVAVMIEVLLQKHCSSNDNSLKQYMECEFPNVGNT